MSSKGRRNRKPWSHKTPPLTQATRFNVAIVTAPYVATDRVFLRRDLRLVRAAIMYADHVQLISPGAQMIQQIAPLRNATGRDAAVMLRSLDDTTIAYLSDGEGLPEGWQDALDLLLRFDAQQWDAWARLPARIWVNSARSVGEWTRRSPRPQPNYEQPSPTLLSCPGTQKCSPLNAQDS